jgi:hypothetical protein
MFNLKLALFLCVILCISVGEMTNVKRRDPLMDHLFKDKIFPFKKKHVLPKTKNKVVQSNWSSHDVNKIISGVLNSIELHNKKSNLRVQHWYQPLSSKAKFKHVALGFGKRRK